MSRSKIATIIVSSYNYGRFLGDAIDSALNQTHSDVEVIVVDDGSTDNSREVIARYGKRITAVLKPNAGQASAFNSGFAASRGDVVLFLDSDDVLCPTAAARAVERLQDLRVPKVHWPLWVIDRYGRKTGEINTPNLPEGDLREFLLRGGPGGYLWPTTSGNAWARWFLEKILPMPEAEYTTCPDYYLSAFVPLFGPLKKISEPQSCWRVHGENHSSRRRERFEDRLVVGARRLEHCFGALADYCRASGLDVDPEAWRQNSWVQVYRATQEINRLIPPGDSFILVDQEAWGADDTIMGRRRIPFLERDGQYWGPPPDDETAIRELERLRQMGARFIAFVWPQLWWLKYYSGLHRYLRSRFRCALENNGLVLFDLRL
jgi:glycosyltransferase involved in cell wall biosynthesis